MRLGHPENGVNKKLMFQLFAPLLALIGLVFVTAYKLLVGWWADPLVARRNYNEFRDEIRENLDFLFTEHSALIRDREGIAVRPGFDYAIVTITVRGLLLRFVRGREDFRVDVAPQHSPASWQEVGSVLAFDGVVDQDGERLRYYRLNDFGQLLKKNLGRLEYIMSEDQFGNLKSSQSPVKLIPL